jgi:hypothetical protein
MLFEVNVLLVHEASLLYCAQIALQSWFQRNYTSIVAMFEDRFELWTIERHFNMEGAMHIGDVSNK